MWIAYCYASGLIGFGEETPEGALPICAGLKKTVEEIVEVKARHSRTSDDLIVPGIPEAESQEKALDALVDFQAVVFVAARCRDKPLLHGLEVSRHVSTNR